MRPGLPRFRRAILIATAFAVAVMSCGREPTGLRPIGLRYSGPIAFNTKFPAGYLEYVDARQKGASASAVPGNLANQSAGDVVAFDRVRVILRNPDGSIAKDTVISFPAGEREVPVTLTIPIPASAPASGQPLTGTLTYMNGTTVVLESVDQFTLTVVPSAPGSAPPPPIVVNVEVVYVGPGSQATTVQISPPTATVNTGGAFAFTAVAKDASGATVNSPIVFESANPAVATIDPVTGAGVAGAARGSTAIRARLVSNGAVSSATLTVNSPAAALVAVSGSGQTAAVNATLTQPVVVQVNATDGGPASGVTVTFTSQNGGSVGSATAVTGADGRAQTTWRLGGTPGAQTLTASAAGLSGSPQTFAATARAVDPVRLAFLQQPPATAQAGATFTPAVSVQAVDASGALTPAFTGPVTLSLASGGAPGVSLGGTLTVNAVAGVATFPDIAISAPGTYTLGATSGGLTAAASSSVQITAGDANRLVFGGYPVSGATAGSALGAISVTVKDALGNTVTSFTGSVTLATVGEAALANGAATAHLVLNGTTTVNAVAGVATFTGISITTAGSYALLATAGTIAAASGPNFTITPAAASALSLVGGGGQSAAGGAVLPAPIAIKVSDAFGNGVAGVTVNFAPTGSSGSVNPASGVTDASGVTQTVWTIGGAAGAMTLNVSSVGLTPNPLVIGATATTTTVAGPATQLIFTQPPTNVAATVAFSPAIQVTAKDVNGLVATSFTGNVTIAITTNPSAGSLSGTLTVAAVAGIANFPGLSINNTGVGYVLSATSGALTAATSSAFNVTGGAIATTTYATHLDSLYSFGDFVTRTAVSRDATGAVVAGTITYVSRNAAVATVTAAGLMTAVANGSVYIVATEAGGTKDSTLVVVQQRVATVNVTPGNRNIYKTRTFQFTASAVDGRGNAMASAPIVWSTVAPSVATTDAAGLVTAVTLGSTQLRATSGAIVGVANVTVLTPITRIVVGRDSSGVPVTDTTAVVSLGIRRAMRAEARDTLDAPMTGVTFTWASTNPTVALLDTIQPTRATALSNANGITTIQATADGITGSAQLKVQQVLASIDLSPTPSTIGVGAQIQLTARGLDANARFISGGTFAYTSRTPAIATVNATTGVVTGVALGTDTVTATSGAITSNNAVVVVASVVPASISFGRDTLSVGRGAGVSIPVYLSRPNAAAPVTIALSARDTNAYFSVGSVTITYPATSANITLNGRNAGTTLIYATETTGNGFSGDTAVVAVTANMNLTNANYYLNSGDQVATQVLLSDPSPAGGTYVTFSYGTANRAQVSPDPAFIPAGQLASNIVITALGGVNGSTTITPIATGVNGTPSTLSTYAPILNLSTTTFRIGAGQYEPNVYAYTNNSVVNALPLTFASTDTNVVTVASSGAIPAGSYYYYFATKGKAVGTAKVIVSSPGWTPDTVTVVVTTPRTTVSAGTNFQTTSPQQSMTIYATDSTGNGHYRVSSLALTVSSSDTNVIKIVDKTPSIAADQYYVSGVRFQMGGSGGTAYIKVVAGGHTPDSILVNVVGPKLEFSWGSALQLGKGQYEPNVYMYVPNSVVSPLTITLTSANPAKVSVPATVTIPTGTYYVYFNVTGADTTTLTSIIATAPGYQGDTANVRVSSPRLNVSGSTTLNAFGPSQAWYVYSSDTNSTSHYRSTPLSISVSSTNPAVVTVDSSTVTIGTGQYYTTNPARVSPVGTGTAYIVATAPGHRPDSTLYTVQTPKLNLSWGTQVIGRKQYNQSCCYVYTPDYRTSPLNVTLTQSNPAADSLNTTTPTIPNGTYYQYFDIAGRVVGTDTIIASAPGYIPDTAIVKISSVKLGYGGGLPSNAQTTSGASTLYVYAFDSLNSARTILDTVTVRLTSSDTTVIKPAQPFVTILRGQYYTTFAVNYFGPGSAYITMTDTAASGYGSVNSNTVTVTGPSLVFSSTTAMYGMRQSGPSGGEHYVYTQNNVATNTTVNLVSSAPSVATVPASVVIPAGSNYVYFKITAQDTVGTIQITANASGFGPPTPITVQVTQPKFVINTSTSARTTTSPQGIYVYATDANGTAHYVTEDVKVGLATSSASVFTVDSTFVTIATGNYYNGNARWIPGANGGTSAQLTAVDCTGVASGCPPTTRSAIYAYTGASANLSVATPLAELSWSNVALGIGQYIDPAYDGSYYAYTQDYMAANTTVNLTHLGNAIETTTPASVVIPSASYYQYFRITGNTAGTDTIQASIATPLHANATATVTVSQGTVTLSGWPATLAAVGDSVLVTMYVRDPNASAVRRVAAATTFTLTPNSKVEFRQGGAVVTSVTVPIDGSQVQFYVKSLASGSATIQVTNANYQTHNNTATVP